ncbi:MAG: hypothetical protein JWO10_2215 [Microbacteriaceae bacterium]|nr:hypothetical protein [Microbacteriaceae bacterium]
MQPTSRIVHVFGFFRGIGYLFQGMRLWGTNAKIFWIGTIPAIMVGVVYGAGIVLLLINADSIVNAVTAFSVDWVEPWRTFTKVIIGIALVIFAVVLLINTYTAIVLAVGDLFYERIWHRVEHLVGGAPAETPEGFWRSLGRGAGNGLRLLIATVLVALGAFAIGFIPVIGAFAAPVFGAIFGGYFLAVELCGYAFDARRMSLSERRRMLGDRRATTLGFGVATYVLFLIPLGAVLVMPAAVAGATLLSRAVLDADAAQPLVVHPNYRVVDPGSSDLRR